MGRYGKARVATVAPPVTVGTVGCEQIQEVCSGEQESGMGRCSESQLEFESQGDITLLASGCE